MVPCPGPNPKDPLYFVTEIVGKVKAVTREGRAQHPRTGYVFVSFLYRDVNHVMRNALVRFKSTPKVSCVKTQGNASFNKVNR